MAAAPETRSPGAAPDLSRATCRMGHLTLDPCSEVVMRDAAPRRWAAGP